MLPYYIRDNQYFFKHNNKEGSILGDSLIINPTNLEELISYITNKNIKSIVVNSSYFKVDNLEFLKDIPAIEGVTILQDDLDISPLSHVHNLKVLRLGEIKQPLDFANFPKLEVLGVTFTKHTLNIPSCKNLFWLWLDKFNKPELTHLGDLQELKYLNLHHTSIISLQGIEKLHKLIYLRIDTASKLETLEGLSGTNTNLETIDVYGAKKLSNYSAIAQVPLLKKVFFSKTGETTDISFLRKLHNLQHAIIGMKVSDGDMLCLKNIAEGGFVDYPHYNLKFDVRRENLQPTSALKNKG